MADPSRPGCPLDDRARSSFLDASEAEAAISGARASRTSDASLHLRRARDKSWLCPLLMPGHFLEDSTSDVFCTRGARLWCPARASPASRATTRARPWRPTPVFCTRVFESLCVFWSVDIELYYVRLRAYKGACGLAAAAYRSTSLLLREIRPVAQRTARRGWTRTRRARREKSRAATPRRCCRAGRLPSS